MTRVFCDNSARVKNRVELDEIIGGWFAARSLDVHWIIAAGMCAITLYCAGILLHALLGLPGPVCMLFLAVAMKLAKCVPAKLEQGADTLFKFFLASVTYPRCCLPTQLPLHTGAS